MFRRKALFYNTLIWTLIGTLIETLIFQPYMLQLSSLLFNFTSYPISRKRGFSEENITRNNLFAVVSIFFSNFAPKIDIYGDNNCRIYTECSDGEYVS